MMEMEADVATIFGEWEMEGIVFSISLFLVCVTVINVISRNVGFYPGFPILAIDLLNLQVITAHLFCSHCVF